MRVVIAAAAVLIASSGAAFVPPPPPPPLGSSFPSDIEGYSTDGMNAVYRHWLRAQANEYGFAALANVAPKRAEDSQGTSMYALREGPKVSLFVSLDDGVDHYAFHLVCPRSANMPSPSLAPSRDYNDAVRNRCAWQVTRARVRFREIEGEIGEKQLRPDFARLARLLKQAGVPADLRTKVPDEVFLALGSPEPLFARATSLAAVSATQCSAISAFLASLDQRQVRLDIADIAVDRAAVTPPIEASTIRLEIPILHGGNGSGTVTLTDEGSGLASDALRAMRERIEPCLENGSSAVQQNPRS